VLELKIMSYKTRENRGPWYTCQNGFGDWFILGGKGKPSFKKVLGPYPTEAEARKVQKASMSK